MSYLSLLFVVSFWNFEKFEMFHSVWSPALIPPHVVELSGEHYFLRLPSGISTLVFVVYGHIPRSQSLDALYTNATFHLSGLSSNSFNHPRSSTPKKSARPLRLLAVIKQDKSHGIHSRKLSHSQSSYSIRSNDLALSGETSDTGRIILLD
jgi:hypothetical protein